MNVLLFNGDIYDLFYEKHSIKDVTYLLMNKKILLFQKYETVSANEGTVFSDFTSDDSMSNLAKIKSNFINDDNFDKKDNYEKNYYRYRSYKILRYGYTCNIHTCFCSTIRNETSC